MLKFNVVYRHIEYLTKESFFLNILYSIDTPTEILIEKRERKCQTVGSSLSYNLIAKSKNNSCWQYFDMLALLFFNKVKCVFYELEKEIEKE